MCAFTTRDGERRRDGAILQYSLERDCKICVVLMTDRQMKKVNLRVTHLDADGFDAVLAGRKKPVHIAMNDVLTAAYARGDQGALE